MLTYYFSAMILALLYFSLQKFTLLLLIFSQIVYNKSGDNMNKKGFTLIELLSTIAIMSIIATVLTINIVNIFSEKEKASEENLNHIITTAASIYIELSENKDLKETCKIKGCNISTDTLIENGLLSEEDVDRKKVINIYYENEEQKYQIN